MAKATGSTSRLAFITEVTAGTTPATPAMTIIRATGESLKAEREFVYSNELNGIRGAKNATMTKSWGSGGFDFEWTFGTLDSFLESACRGAFSTNVLVDALAPKSFTVEAKYEDGTTDTFKRIVGAEVNKFSLSLKAGEIVTGSVDFLARSSDYAQAIITGATYPVGNTEAVVSGNDIGALTFSGYTLDTISELTFELDNGLQPAYGLGTIATALDIVPGNLQISGSLTAYLDSTNYTLLRGGLDGPSPTALTFTPGQAASKGTRFELLSCVVEPPEIVAKADDGGVMATMKWRAIQNAGIGATIRITRAV